MISKIILDFEKKAGPREKFRKNVGKNLEKVLELEKQSEKILENP